MHGHWVVPGGVIAAAARAGAAARRQPARIGRLRRRDALAPARPRRADGLRPRRLRDRLQRRPRRGARSRSAPTPDRVDVVPYGVDPDRFRPDPSCARGAAPASASRPDTPLLFAAGRLVRKKGFEYLIDALAAIPQEVGVQAAIAGAGDLDDELRARARERAHRRPRSLPGQPLAGRGRGLAAPPPTSSRSVGARRQRQRRRPAEHRARSARLRHAARHHAGRRHRIGRRRTGRPA